MLSLACRDAGYDCPHVMTAETEDELMRKASEHAQSVHNMNLQNITPEAMSRIKSVIKRQ
jgi:predicted small metal-binding protein